MPPESRTLVESIQALTSWDHGTLERPRFAFVSWRAAAPRAMPDDGPSALANALVLEWLLETRRALHQVESHARRVASGERAKLRHACAQLGMSSGGDVADWPLEIAKRVIRQAAMIERALAGRRRIDPWTVWREMTGLEYEDREDVFRALVAPTRDVRGAAIELVAAARAWVDAERDRMLAGAERELLERLRAPAPRDAEGHARVTVGANVIVKATIALGSSGAQHPRDLDRLLVRAAIEGAGRWLTRPRNPKGGNPKGGNPKGGSAKGGTRRPRSPKGGPQLVADHIAGAVLGREGTTIAAKTR